MVSPLSPRVLVFSTHPSSPLDPHLYLSSIHDLPPRNSNPLPQTLPQGLSQTLPLPTPMDFKPSFRPINLSSARISAQPEPFLSKEQVLHQLNQYQDFDPYIEEAIQNAHKTSPGVPSNLDNRYTTGPQLFDLTIHNLYSLNSLLDLNNLLGSFLHYLWTEDIGYGIRDAWIDPRDIAKEEALTTLEGVNTRMTELAAVQEQDTQDIYGVMEDAQHRQTEMFQRVETLVDDSRYHYETGRLVDQEARCSREAWAHSIGLSSADTLIATLTTQLSSLQGHLVTALGEIQALQAREQARAGAPK
nr:hypothetical protein [Tanacetum cinerariifolium]